jgi:hypothetical protein
VLTFSGTAPVALLDLAGREAMRLRPGANDVRRLAPGIYFLRPRGSALPQKVVIER